MTIQLSPLPLEDKIDSADVTISYLIESALWCFWETECPEDMIIGPFDTEDACRAGVEEFYRRDNPFTSGQTDYVITHVARKQARWVTTG
jgi:hypothetical protein